MQRERRVVVLVLLRLFERKDGKMMAARLNGLNLTSYGYSVKEAVRNVRLQYDTFIKKNRQMGTLEKVLNRAGVEWYWEDEYDGTIPIVDAHIDEIPIDDREGQWNDITLEPRMLVAA